MWYKRRQEKLKKKSEQETHENLENDCELYRLEIQQQDSREYDMKIWHMSYSGRKSDTN